MTLLGASTSVPVAKTVAELQLLLQRAHARSVTIVYDGSRAPVALRFELDTVVGRRSFRISVDVDAVRLALRKEHAAGRLSPRFTSPQPAAMTGWRILLHRLESELAIVATGAIALEHSLLAYMPADDSTDSSTFYQMLASGRLALSAPKEYR